MTEKTLSQILAVILVVGHIGLFAYAFVILINHGRGDLLDTVQLVLTGTPLLAVAVAAFQAINGHAGGTTPAEAVQVFLDIFVAVALVAVIAYFYTQLLYANGLGSEMVKVAVGTVETAFGAFVAVLRKKFFPDA